MFLENLMSWNSKISDALLNKSSFATYVWLAVFGMIIRYLCTIHIPSSCYLLKSNIVWKTFDVQDPFQVDTTTFSDNSNDNLTDCFFWHQTGKQAHKRPSWSQYKTNTVIHRNHHHHHHYGRGIKAFSWHELFAHVYVRFAL